jgi:purine-binding chemotaxis protein CheW
MPNQPAWCFGLLRYRERNVRVVDTGTMVIPPDREELLPTDPPKHLLIVGDGRWALACSAIGKVVRLTAEDVRWRTDTRSRPWLAGTVLNHLCALVDTEAFARMLADASARKPSWRAVGASPRPAAAQGET